MIAKPDLPVLRVGLTGGIASGKSTIREFFAKLGAVMIDADQLVAELYRSGAAGHEALVHTYGPEILRPDGEIDREKLAAVAFRSPEDAQKLNHLIHPLVLDEADRRIAGISDGIVIVEATLLIESGAAPRYDKLVVVDIEPQTQIARGVARGMSREELTRRIANQMPREERLRHADYVIENNEDLGAAERRTCEVFNALLEELKRREAKSSS
ncbi:MAG TPA: dephospho-CoA kinase [Thermoanaerobaculia bacterium]|nr:dephospho-CoA kinase [Thermoanaerobaculia bacterium]